MKILLTFSTFLALAWLSVGCSHAQVKPTVYQVNLTWSAPAASGSWAGCTASAPCTYVVSRIAATSTCPAPNVTTPNYTPLNSSTPASSTNFSDTSAAGTTVCYIVQTEQGGAVSNPSNAAGPFVVPSSPIAPTLSGATQTAEAKPLPDVDSAKPAPVLTASLSRQL